MLIHSGLPKKFWGEAVRYANIIENSSSTKSVQDKSPYEVWYQQKPDVSKFKVFGCRVLTLEHEKVKKFSVKTNETIYLGSATGRDRCRLFKVDTQEFICSRDVKVLEWQTRHLCQK
jgi:hypothetical protein